jgi:hypothetical protein
MWWNLKGSGSLGAADLSWEGGPPRWAYGIDCASGLAFQLPPVGGDAVFPVFGRE